MTDFGYQIKTSILSFKFRKDKLNYSVVYQIKTSILSFKFRKAMLNYFYLIVF